MNKSNLTTVLKALYNFVTKRIGEVREAAAKAQSTADKAQSTADKAQSTADKAQTAAATAQTTADSKVTEAQVNTLIDNKLGVIENGSY